MALGPPKQKALLAQLAVEPGRPIPVETLIDALWPEQPPRTARHALQVYVSALRRAFGDPTRIQARSRAYLLREGGATIDLIRFRALVATARQAVQTDPADAAVRLRRGLALWRGRALADLDGEPGARDLVLALEEERLEALELRIDADLANGFAGELIAELERLVADHPARERFHAQLMLALYRAGRQRDALRTYRRAHSSLLRELGLGAGPELRRLEAAILRHDSALTVEPPHVRARRHLPAAPNTFVGRERELAELMRLASGDHGRLITLVGPGGVGKTRLALAVAHNLAGEYADGVWFADFASLRDPSLIAETIGRALHTRVDLKRHLADRRLLIVADNLEHLLAGADTLADLLRVCPGLVLLVTSRERLRLYGEHIYDVQPLSEEEAATLFQERARAVLGDARFGETEREICRRLDGLPLAIELAAARLRELTAGDLLEGLTSRLRVLVEGPRNVPARHVTVRATIEWSVNLLDPAELHAFERLAVFAGGWTEEAALTVSGTAPGTLGRLVDASLVGRSGGRMAMLETVHELAGDRLGARPDRDVWRRRHLDWCTELVEEAWSELHEGDQASWLARLEAERANIRAALDFSRAHGLKDEELALAARCGAFWYMQSNYAEGRRQLGQALEGSVESPAELRAVALQYAATLAAEQGDSEDALALMDDALALGPQLERRTLAEVLGGHSMVLALAGDTVAATAVMGETLAVSRDAGHHWVTRYTLNNLGCLSWLSGDGEKARWYFEEALAFEPRRDLHLTAGLHSNLAALLAEQGATDEARVHNRQALVLLRELGLRHAPVAAEALSTAAWVAARDGRSEQTARLVASIGALLREESIALMGPFVDLYATAETFAQEHLSEDGGLPSLGHPLKLEAAIESALEVLGEAEPLPSPRVGGS